MSERRSQHQRSLLDLPDDAAVEQAVWDFARDVSGAYGNRLKGVYLFGSRARGDHQPESDADVAVVVDDGDASEWTETKRLNALAFQTLLRTGAEIQPLAIPFSRWSNIPELARSGMLLTVRREAKQIAGGGDNG